VSGFQASRPLDAWRWLGVPFAACIIATVLFAIPVRFLGLALPEPVFPLVPAFAWAVIRPSVLPPLLLILLGLFLDVFWYAPMGLWATSLLIAYGFVLLTRAAMTGQSRLMLWIWFAAAGAMMMATAYLLTMLDALITPNLVATLWQLAASVLLYPFAHRLIQRFEDADVRFR
jgi:rod shape-determining protein MreD